MIQYLHDLTQKPAPFEPGEPLFWNDTHISKMMLEAHLSPNHDAASRRPATIDAHISWMLDFLHLQLDAAWLDLGCGPGLYTSRLAARGVCVSGMDYSKRSIAYAKAYAEEHHLNIDYRYQNYLTLDDVAQYDVVSLIYGDFCPLSPDDRAQLLANVQRALKPGGYFVLDVTTPLIRQRVGLTNNWYVMPEGGFWKPTPHFVLEQGFAYADDVYLDQSVVIEDNEVVTVYRNWFQDYTPERITAELTTHGFKMIALNADLAGTPYTDDSEWIGLVVQH